MSLADVVADELTANEAAALAELEALGRRSHAALGERLGLHAETVRKIELRALRRLRAALEHRGVTFEHFVEALRR